ncbi:MAG: hypothetical protein CK521_03340 [Acidimicrobium sp.]|nr:MAG: hypothetical protein CK521_03340 [Acidimicrobium sp.]
MHTNKEALRLSPSDWVRHGAVYVALATIAIAQPLLQLYGENIAVFAAAGFEGAIVVWFAAITLLMPPVCLLIFEIVATMFFPSQRTHIHLGLVWILLWFVTSVVLRSMSVGPWIIDSAVTAFIAAALVYFYQRHQTMRSWIMMLSPLPLVIAIVFASSAHAVIWPPSISVVDVTAKTVNPADSLLRIAPKDVSVLWIVLDEAPLWPLLRADGTINKNRFPGFAALAESSTWYRNVVGTSQTTTDAVPAMLTGKWPKSGVGPVLANHPDNLFTLMNGHLAMDSHEVATALCPRKVCRTVSVTGGTNISDPLGTSENRSTTTTVAMAVKESNQRVSMTSFLRDAAVVVGHKALPAGLRNKLPPIDEGWGAFGAVDALDTDTVDEVATDTTVPRAVTAEGQSPAESTTVSEWEQGGPMSQVPVVEGVVTRASRADRPTLHFAHVLLPHRPWMLTPDMRRSRALPTDKRSNMIIDRVRDEYQAHLLQYAATDTVIENMVATMKKSKNWDRTMIIVTADHGLTFMPGESKRKTINAENKATLEDIYRIPLFIKYPAQQAGSTDDCTASSIDILPTVIAATRIDAGWKTDGADLLHACPARTSRSIIWPDGTAQMASTFSAVQARALYYSSWIASDGSVDDITRAGANGELVGTTLVANAENETELLWSLDRPEDFQNIGSKRLSFVPAQVQGRLIASRDFGPNEEGLLVVDGAAVGVISELAGLRDGASTTFRSTLLSRLLTAGKHQVALWTTARSPGGSSVIRLVAG